MTPTGKSVEIIGAVVRIPVNLIDVGQNWRGANLRGVEELAVSIRRTGLREPITVVDTGAGRFEVFEGHRRLAAVTALGHAHIAAIVRQINVRDRALLQIAIHAQRLGFDPIAEAKAISWALFDQDGPKPGRDEIAEIVGKSPRWVADRLQLLNLPKHEQEQVSAGRLSASSALQLLRDRATAGTRTATYRPSARRSGSPATASRPAAPVGAVSAESVVLARVAELVGGCVGCSCCRAVSEVLSASA